MALRVVIATIALGLMPSLTSPPTAQAEPLTPLTSEEIRYLNALHQVLPGSGDPMASHSDGWLLDRGHYACVKKSQGFVGATAIPLSPIITQVAYAVLCPG